LTDAAYHDSVTEDFSNMDDLGNRSGSINLRSGTVNFTVDDDTNRYTSIGGNSTTHDDAGNLTTDKNGYKFTYDYENRIIEIKDSSNNDVADFTYDALGRRIEKDESGTVTRYYYSDKWQVFTEYDGDDNFKRWYLYGNYVDEVLFSPGVGGNYYYLHDHLYSPVALISDPSGTVLERYEYDAYGKVSIMSASYEPRATSDYNNPYYFTGRRLDELDGGDLSLMYYRNRSYDTYTGRFFQHDPLGINPAGGKTNPFAPRKQYKDGMNLYTYCDNSPMMNTDPSGKHFAPPIITPWPIIKPILKVCGSIRLTIAVPCAVGLAAIASTCEIAFSGEDTNHCCNDRAFYDYVL
jgi:RHS repeat-associated protein